MGIFIKLGDGLKWLYGSIRPLRKKVCNGRKPMISLKSYKKKEATLSAMILISAPNKDQNNDLHIFSIMIKFNLKFKEFRKTKIFTLLINLNKNI